MSEFSRDWRPPTDNWDSDMEIFNDHDDPYLDWLRENPRGYVLNRRRGKSDNYLVLHTATCKKIKEYTGSARPGGFTSREYIKVCSNDIKELEDYARQKGGRPDGSFSRRCACNP
jgi:hypothetical protein